MYESVFKTRFKICRTANYSFFLTWMWLTTNEQRLLTTNLNTQFIWNMHFEKQFKSKSSTNRNARRLRTPRSTRARWPLQPADCSTRPRIFGRRGRHRCLSPATCSICWKYVEISTYHMFVIWLTCNG